MQTVFTTSSVASHERFDYWHSVASKTIAPHEGIPACRASFEASLQVGSLLDMTVLLARSSPMTVSVDACHIRGINPDDVIICRVLMGTIQLNQLGRTTLLRPGDFTVLDVSSPHSERYIDAAAWLMLRMSRRELEGLVGTSIRSLAGIAFTKERAECELASSYLERLPLDCAQFTPAACGIVREQVLDLLTLCLTGSSAMNSGAQSLLALRIRAVIDAALSDPDLSARTVAERVGLTATNANRLLARQGTSVSKLILARRLAGCAQVLKDSRQRHRTVSEIAFAWGFKDLTHFGRRFREVFGLPPREFRHEALRVEDTFSNATRPQAADGDLD